MQNILPLLKSIFESDVINERPPYQENAEVVVLEGLEVTGPTEDRDRVWGERKPVVATGFGWVATSHKTWKGQLGLTEA